MTRRIFVDTEWTAPPWSEACELMWIGLADEAGRSWYGISSEVEIEPTKNDFISGAFRLITPDEPRLTREKLATAVIDFCGDVDEFWAWIPSLESFTDWFGLGEEAEAVYAKVKDVDLQMLQALVQPWPTATGLNSYAILARPPLKREQRFPLGRKIICILRFMQNGIRNYSSVFARCLENKNGRLQNAP